MSAPHFFDEMGLEKQDVRHLYRHIEDWLEQTPADVLAARRAQAEYMFRRIGITFGVYGDKDAAERLIPFDIIPRLISRAEWSRLEAGLVQRVNALNLFLRDVYGAGAILKALGERLAKNPSLAKENGALIQLDVTGPESANVSHWVLDFTGAGAVREGTEPKATTKLRIDDGDLVALTKDPGQVRDFFQRGKLRVDGDVRPAHKLSFLKDL